jgi:O-antigen/teichoic acid export membrane protein
MSETRRFGINIMSNTIANVIGSAAQLALLVVLARVTGVSDFAGYVSAVAIVAIAEPASDFGTRIWATKKFALHGNTRNVLFKALKSKLFYSALMAVVVLSLPLKTLSIFNTLLCVLIAVTQYSTDPVTWYLVGKERMHVDATILLAWRVGNALLLAVLAFAGFPLEWLLAAWLAVNCLRILVESRLKAARELFIDQADDVEGGARDGFFHLIKLVFPIGTALLLISLFHRVGVITLGALGDVTGVAVFGAAFSLVLAAGMLTNSIALASFPMLSRALDLAENEKASGVARRMLLLIACVCAPICLGGMALSPFITKLLYGQAYAESGLVMIILMPTLYLAGVNYALKYTLNAMHLYWQDAASLVIGLIAYVAVILYLPQTLSVSPPAATALGWGAGETTIFLSKWFILARDGRLETMPMGVVLALTAILSALTWGAYAYFS